MQLRSLLLLLLAPALSDAVMAQDVPASKASNVDLAPVLAAKKDVIPALLCTNGELVRFSRDRIDSIAGNTVRLKPGTYMMKMLETPATTDRLEQRTLIKRTSVFGFPHNGEWTSGRLKGWSGKGKEAFTCDVAAVWEPIVNPDPFDDPLVINQFGMSGAVQGSATYDFIKVKNLPKPATCVVTMVSAPPWTESFADDLRGWFMAKLMSKPKKGVGLVASRDAVPAGAHFHEMRVMLFGTGSEETRSLVMNALLTLRDPNGRLIAEGHAYRQVGKKRQADAEDLADYLLCN